MVGANGMLRGITHAWGPCTDPHVTGLGWDWGVSAFGRGWLTAKGYAVG